MTDVTVARDRLLYEALMLSGVRLSPTDETVDPHYDASLEFAEENVDAAARLLVQALDGDGPRDGAGSRASTDPLAAWQRDAVQVPPAPPLYTLGAHVRVRDSVQSYAGYSGTVVEVGAPDIRRVEGRFSCAGGKLWFYVNELQPAAPPPLPEVGDHVRVKTARPDRYGVVRRVTERGNVVVDVDGGGVLLLARDNTELTVEPAL